MIKKIISKVLMLIFKILEVLNRSVYIKYFPKYLYWLGVQINPKREAGYIAPSVEFDGNDYKLIKIGDATTISKNVLLLTHDYSIKKGLYVLGKKTNARFLKSIEIGNNCLIGARCCILPGTKIGNNVIIGTGAVVKGHIPDNCIVIGNPAKIVANIETWTNKHIEFNDFLE
ncbi:acyltransferase [uncultured Phocaeicola sp.]|uniref:acyltransferase n=1 Tax=uncultured Phocaeicola sp. TaxID=990718 RepID=UPI0025F22EB3|nr:acyltransferase [uncultured Phocaeicola sp.]